MRYIKTTQLLKITSQNIFSAFDIGVSAQMQRLHFVGRAMGVGVGM
jgi:hypothetical protein